MEELTYFCVYSYFCVFTVIIFVYTVKLEPVLFITQISGFHIIINNSDITAKS